MSDVVSTEEFIDVLRGSRQVAGEIERGERPGDVGDFRPAAARRIASLLTDCPDEWLQRSDVLVELGLAFGELADFEAAVRHLAAALATDELDSAATLTAVERLANFESRLGERLATDDAADAAQRDRGATLIETAISRLTALGQLGNTVERLALLAGCYKRLASIRRDRAQIRLALEQGARHYRLAHELATERGHFNPYPLLNWIALDTVLGAVPADAEALLTQVQGAARAHFARSRDFFDAVALAEAELVRSLGNGTLSGAAAPVAAEVARLVARYADAIRLTHATARQVDSAATQISTLGRLLRALAAGDPAARRCAAALDELHARIGGRTSAQQPAATAAAPPAPAPARRAKAAPAARRRRPTPAKRARRRAASD
jgi:hypothetical protein